MLAGLILLVVLAALLSRTSLLNRYYFFGRSLTEEALNSPEARAIESRFRFAIWLGLLPTVVAAQAFSRSHLTYLSAVAASPGLLLVYYVAFARANRAASKLPQRAHDAQEIRIPLLAPANRISLTAFLYPCLVLVVFAAVAVVKTASGGHDLRWIAAHFNDRITAMHADGLLGFSISWVLLGPALMFVLRYNSRPNARMTANTARAALMLTWIGCALLSALLLVSAGTAISLPAAWPKIGLLTAIVIALGVAVWRNAGSRSGCCEPTAVDRRNDAYWRWGLFYNNPNDPALLVQSRAGSGYTLNFGRILAWPIAILAWTAFAGIVLSALLRAE